jgi:hypothetical protein
MSRDRTGCGYVTNAVLLIAAGCTSVDAHLQDHAQAAGSPAVAVATLQPSTFDATQAAGAPADPVASSPPSAAFRAFAAGAAGPSVRPPVPGRSARTVLHQELNEAENLFFTEDGRLFVSGGEDIYEIKRAPDGTFTKTDHFDEDCLVEGIVRSGQYLYGVCTLNNDDSQPSFLIAGELSAQPVFRTIAPLDAGSIPNGMTVDAEGRIYITETLTHQIVRVTLASPLEVKRTEVWAGDILFVNGIKYLDHAMYVTMLDATLVSRFLRIPMLPDGSAGRPERLYARLLTVLDDIIVFDGGFIITDFLKGTLIFWDARRGAYAETPAQTFYGPTSLVQGQPPMFTERQLIVAEKGMYLVRDECDGDLLSAYQLP